MDLEDPGALQAKSRTEDVNALNTMHTHMHKVIFYLGMLHASHA